MARSAHFDCLNESARSCSEEVLRRKKKTPHPGLLPARPWRGSGYLTPFLVRSLWLCWQLRIEFMVLLLFDNSGQFVPSPVGLRMKFGRGMGTGAFLMGAGEPVPFFRYRWFVLRSDQSGAPTGRAGRGADVSSLCPAILHPDETPPSEGHRATE